MEKAPTSPTPEIITIYDQAEGITFQYEGYLREEYTALTRVRVTDPRSIIARCEQASDEENGIYLDYPGFRDGLRRRVRIINWFDVSGIDADTHESIFVVVFRVVLSEEDHQDYIRSLGNDSDDIIFS